ncbi:MAG: aminoacyl-tRNA hydrolase [candidate division Zixibacteria bacterium]|nr:aminoacyl-tRNA hydrolase [candidate division Zixibacteria bacterium]
MSGFVINSNIRLIAGLGNPGSKYAGTRHNIGFKIVDALAKAKNVDSFKTVKDFKTVSFRVRGIDRRLIRPITYMNNSGHAVLNAVRRYRLQPYEVLTVTDDTNLLLGKIRVRKSGSDGGHNGLKSIIEHLDTDDFPRLRVGVNSAPHGVLLEDYVLEKFSNLELKDVNKVIELAVDLIFKILQQGIDSVKGTYKAFDREIE